MVTVKQKIAYVIVGGLVLAGASMLGVGIAIGVSAILVGGVIVLIAGLMGGFATIINGGFSR